MSYVLQSKSKESLFLTLVLQVLGVEKPEGTDSLPVDLLINGKLPVRICRSARRWFLCGQIAQEFSHCKKDTLPTLLEGASSAWGTLKGNFSYEKTEDSFFLWQEISEQFHNTQEKLELSINDFLNELEFWRSEVAHAG